MSLQLLLICPSARKISHPSTVVGLRFFFECAPTSGAADEVFAAPLTGRAKSLDKEDGEE